MKNRAQATGTEKNLFVQNLIRQACLSNTSPVEITHGEFKEDSSVLHFKFLHSRYAIQINLYSKII